MIWLAKKKEKDHARLEEHFAKMRSESPYLKNIGHNKSINNISARVECWNINNTKAQNSFWEFLERSKQWEDDRNQRLKEAKIK